MAKYRVVAGRIARFENGKRSEYDPITNPVVDLTEAEHSRFRDLVVPVVVEPEAPPAEQEFRRGTTFRTLPAKPLERDGSLEPKPADRRKVATKTSHGDGPEG